VSERTEQPGRALPVEAPRGLARKTLDAMVWVFSGNGVQALAQVILLAALARLLEPRDFGLYSAALVVSGLALVFSELGVGPALVQRAHLEPRHVRSAFALSLALGTIVALLVVVAAPLVAAFFRMPPLTPLLRVLSLAFLLQGAAVVAESLLQRELDFRRLALVRVGAYVLGYGGVAVTLAALGHGAWALVGGAIAQATLRAVFALVAQPHPVALRADLQSCRDLMGFGAGFTLGRIGNYAAFNADNLVVGRLLGAAALGFYGRAFQLMATPTLLFGEVLDRTLFPAMSRIQDERERLALALRRGVALTALVTLPASIALVLLAPEVVQFLLGPGWEAVVLPLRILAAAILFRTSYKISDSLSRATGAVYARAWRQWLYAGFVVAGAGIGSLWGLPGVAAGVLAASVLNFAVMAHLSLRRTRLPLRAFARAHVAAVPLALVASVALVALVAPLRAVGAPPALTLGAAALAMLAIVAFVLWRRPAVLLGPDGAWMVRLLHERATDLRRRPAPAVAAPLPDIRTRPAGEAE
jgi:O-antigen/teichoic acid export membrane protein